MRTLLSVRISVQAGNRAIKDGRIGQLLEATAAELKPEYSFFYLQDGRRSANFIFDYKDPSDMPRIVERLFGELDAEIELHPVMNADDLRKGLGKLKG